MLYILKKIRKVGCPFSKIVALEIWIKWKINLKLKKKSLLLKNNKMMINTLLKINEQKRDGKNWKM